METCGFTNVLYCHNVSKSKKKNCQKVAKKLSKSCQKGCQKLPKLSKSCLELVVNKFFLTMCYFSIKSGEGGEGGVLGQKVVPRPLATTL
jgi:hypothetical protein